MTDGHPTSAKLRAAEARVVEAAIEETECELLRNDAAGAAAILHVRMLPSVNPRALRSRVAVVGAIG